MSAPHGSLRACRSAGTLAPTLAMNSAATKLAIVARSLFSTPELSAHCSRLAHFPPQPALAAAPARLPPLGLPRRLGREWKAAHWLGSATPVNGWARGPTFFSKLYFNGHFDKFNLLYFKQQLIAVNWFLTTKMLHKILSL